MNILLLLLAVTAHAADLAPLWLDGPPADAKAWDSRRAELLKGWRDVLGEFPAQKPPLSARTVGEVERFAGYTRQKVAYEIEQGISMDAVLFLPEKTAPSPGIVVFHPTLKTHYAQVAGHDTASPEKMMGPQLAARGFAVLCPRCFIFDDHLGYADAVVEMKKTHPTWRGMTRMTWDGIRALDFLASQPGVDAQRLGVIGHSLGAKEVLYVAAFDERVKAAVFSEGGIGLAMSNWQDVWYLGPSLAAGREHHELLALIAPRPLLLLAGGGIDGADHMESERFLGAVRPLYERLGSPGAAQFFLHGDGHRYPPAAREKAEAFFEAYLRR